MHAIFSLLLLASMAQAPRADTTRMLASDDSTVVDASSTRQPTAVRADATPERFDVSGLVRRTTDGSVGVALCLTHVGSGRVLWSDRLAGASASAGLPGAPFVARTIESELRIGAIREQAGLMREDRENAGVNTQMTAWAGIKDRLLAGPKVEVITEQVFAALDVSGYNYLDSRYVSDGEQFPNRVIVGSETHVTGIARAWPIIEAHSHVIGDFTWTGWDYLGEIGIGRTEFAADDDPTPGRESVAGTYPWLVAHTGDIDVTGFRRPQSYFREILRTAHGSLSRLAPPRAFRPRACWPPARA